MRANLLFDLDDADDRMEHLRCIKSLDMALAIWDFSNKIKSLIKHLPEGEHLNEDHVWNVWSETLEHYDINLDKLIS